MGVNQYGSPDGIWLTKEQLDFVTRIQYDENDRDKPVKMGGRWFPPSAFVTVLDERELKDIIKYSTTMSSSLLESLAEEGYLAEVKQACVGTGYAGFVDKLVDSGKYKMIEATNETPSNSDNKKRLDAMKSAFLKGKAIDANTN